MMARVVRIPDDHLIDPRNEDWLKLIARDVDVEGEEIPNIFDRMAEQRGEKFTPLRDREPKK